MMGATAPRRKKNSRARVETRFSCMFCFCQREDVRLQTVIIKSLQDVRERTGNVLV